MKIKRFLVLFLFVFLSTFLVCTILPRRVHAAKTKTVYFVDAQNWGQVSCHYWFASNTGANTSWPGETMSVSHQNGQNQNVYSLDVSIEEGDSISYVFNDGRNTGTNATQTIDINNSGNNNYFIPTVQEASQKWVVDSKEFVNKHYQVSPLKSGEINGSLSFDYTNNDSEYYFFTRPNRWDVDQMYCYGFKDSSTNNTWPGVVMNYAGTTSEGKHQYYILKSELASFTTIIFNNGTSKTKKSQTVDIVLADHAGKNAFVCNSEDPDVGGTYSVSSSLKNDNIVRFVNVKMYFNVLNTDKVELKGDDGFVKAQGFIIYISNGTSTISTNLLALSSKTWTKSVDLLYHETVELTIMVKLITQDDVSLDIGSAQVSAKSLAAKYLTMTDLAVVQAHQAALQKMANLAQ